MSCNKRERKMSPLRRTYSVKLILRCVIFFLCIGICQYAPGQLEILQGMNFFQDFSVLHLLWLIWVIDMLCQMIPIKDKIPLGSQKLFGQRFRPAPGMIDSRKLRDHVVATTKSAYKVFLLWALLLAVIGTLYFGNVLDETALFMISVAFYVCDLICVLIWCPFRLLMKNRCCTTCRIFNWDHLMMFTPMMFMGGFFALSLLAMALAVWILWELSVMKYPERFWDQSNAALKCSSCTDKLCTQYCQKLRKASNARRNDI